MRFLFEKYREVRVSLPHLPVSRSIYPPPRHLRVLNLKLSPRFLEQYSKV